MYMFWLSCILQCTCSFSVLSTPLPPSSSPDSFRESYTQLRAQVMAYGGITPEGSLVFSDSSHLSTTMDTSHSTLAGPHPPDHSIAAPGVSGTSLAVEDLGGRGQATPPPAAKGVQAVAKVWRSHSSTPSAKSSSRPASGPAGSDTMVRSHDM